MDQQTYCNTAFHNPVESQDIPDYLFSSNSANTSFENLTTQGSTSLSIWHSGEPSSSGHSVNYCDCDRPKQEHMWPSSMNIDEESPVLEERDFQATGPLSLERVNINLNSNHGVDADSFLQDPNSGDVPQGSDMDVRHSTMTSPASETEPRSLPYNTVLMQSAYLPSTSRTPNPYGSSSGCPGIVLDDSDSRSEASLDSRRLSCKRKNIEGVSGQASSSGNAGFPFHNENSSLHSVSAPHNVATVINISGSSTEAAGSNPSEVQSTERSSAIVRGTVSERYPISVGRVENSERNFRMRFNPTHQHDICPSNIPTTGVTIRHSNVWSSHQPSSHAVPLNHSVDSRLAVSGSSSQPQHQLSMLNRLTPDVHSSQWNGDANSRVGSQPSTGDSGERLNSSGEEVHSRSIHGNSISGHSLLAYPSDIRQTGQDPTHLHIGNHILHGQQQLLEAVRRPPHLGSSVRGERSNIVPAHPSSHLVSSQETNHHSGVGFHGSHQSLLRSAFLAERHNDGVLSAPLSIRNLAAVRESRYRMLSEIRNALDLMRRGENLRFEDVFVLDQSAFFGGGADLHDRHRDMRLDVDNMSYEELLALEERIGNVSTGLGEEKISECLKQRVYIPLATESSSEMEPCCVCQEEYVEGEDIGALECGHDFHAACIKQWLTHKNLCPICKTTGLVT
ncbi:Zinc finger RING/FYVE/PHD-type protein [Dioscorea alata]|uniref:Zinc finger RING/FYVE/PHD-type protein n=2 Tax=Dioscorea alata TaxID=55571 RepID=A0ACB7WL47_DIOAL|nr:Zinc finger RING/FYVE/PHD-type protein [Dioscorea alata]KAH7688635.1 Zinc finger RING/FYVE/PHD-type protein [Dioscorea alata]